MKTGQTEMPDGTCGCTPVLYIVQAVFEATAIIIPQERTKYSGSHEYDSPATLKYGSGPLPATIRGVSRFGVVGNLS